MINLLNENIRPMCNIVLDRVRKQFYYYVVVSCFNKQTVKTKNNACFKVKGIWIVGIFRQSRKDGFRLVFFEDYLN